MAASRVEVPDGEERGFRVGCEDHNKWEEFHPGYRSVVFYCEGCDLEIGISLWNTHD